ncbi:Hypothetical predicted protein [Marmota monax]|uniref:Uncharacterized protein n=1 Tax=Marmota monax TaxID=9995 RepID=A0A5E4B4C4_MARMO|nr:Hypothetical predicted protein [Marmota monax]
MSSSLSLWSLSAALLQKYLDNYDLSIKVIYVLGTLGFSAGTAVMAMFPNVYVAMVTISTMGIVSMSISYCPYALLGHYHEVKEASPAKRLLEVRPGGSLPALLERPIKHVNCPSTEFIIDLGMGVTMTVQHCTPLRGKEVLVSPT